MNCNESIRKKLILRAKLQEISFSFRSLIELATSWRHCSVHWANLLVKKLSAPSSLIFLGTSNFVKNLRFQPGLIKSAFRRTSILVTDFFKKKKKNRKEGEKFRAVSRKKWNLARFIQKSRNPAKFIQTLVRHSNHRSLKNLFGIRNNKTKILHDRFFSFSYFCQKIAFVVSYIRGSTIHRISRPINFCRAMRNFHRKSVNFCKKSGFFFFFCESPFFLGNEGVKGCRAPSSGHRDSFFLARSRRVGGGGGGSF